MRKLLFIVGCLLAAVLNSPANALSFNVTDIGAYAIAGINNSGQVVVQYDTGIYPGQRVGIWQDGSVQLLGMTGATTNPNFEQQEAKGINNNGQVIVRQRTYLTSYVWDNGVFTQIQPLPTPGGTSYGTEVFGINDLGQTVGQGWTGPHDGYHAFFSNNGSTYDICGHVSADGRGGGSAIAINNVGKIVGNGCSQGGSFLYESGQFTALPDFSVSDINDDGVMVGQATGFSSGGKAALWNSNGLQILSTSWGESFAINSQGAVVGAFDNGLGNNSAFMWDGVNGILDLNDYIDPSSGIFLYRAVDINDTGQIIAIGQLTVGGQTYGHSYLLTPSAVPLPPTILLFGSGLLGLIGIARKKHAYS